MTGDDSEAKFVLKRLLDDSQFAYAFIAGCKQGSATILASKLNIYLVLRDY